MYLDATFLDNNCTAGPVKLKAIMNYLVLYYFSNFSVIIAFDVYVII